MSNACGSTAGVRSVEGTRFLRHDVGDTVKSFFDQCNIARLPPECNNELFPQTTRCFLLNKVVGRTHWLFPPLLRTEQYLAHLSQCKANDDVTRNIQTAAIVLLPKWAKLNTFTKQMTLLHEFPAGSQLFVNSMHDAFPAISSPFQLWYDGPNPLKLLHKTFLGLHHPKNLFADEITVNFSSAGPKLQMQFHGMIAGLPAVILADSGASHIIIDKPFVLHHNLYTPMRLCFC